MYVFRDGELYAGGLKVSELAERYGTPLYLYDKDILLHKVLEIEKMTSGMRHLVCFAMKSNSNAYIVGMLVAYGFGVDVVSGGELCIALDSGVPPRRIIFNGNGKRVDEIEFAIDAGILMINVENLRELDIINEIASRKKKKVGIALRWNPEIEVPTHPYLMTALSKSKFGLSKEEVVYAVKKVVNMRFVELMGLQTHIGSNIFSVEPYKRLVDSMVEFSSSISSMGVDLRYIDIGGGWGVNYSSGRSFPVRELFSYLESSVPRKYTLIFEPGRWLIADSGVLVARVLYKKRRGDRQIVIVDAGMNDFMRVSLYGARHGIVAVRKSSSLVRYDFVGPICESGDIFAEDLISYEVDEGDYVAIMKTGAYGFSMASNYNMRPRAAEVLVDAESSFIIRERETVKDLLRGQVLKYDVLQDGR